MSTNVPNCQTCGKPIRYGHSKTYCNSCTVASSRRRSRLRLIKLRGGACAICGYDRTYWALAFHHVDPTTKSFALSGGVTRAWEKLKVEATKCILLCHNCHSEIHAGIIELSAFDSVTGTAQAKILSATLVDDLAAVDSIRTTTATKGHSASRMKRRRAAQHQKICALGKCAAVFITKEEEAKYCSPACATTAARKIKWPTKEKMQRLVWKYPTTYIAERLGMSGSAVTKWCKKNNVDKPPRGYWAKRKSVEQRPSLDELQTLVWQLPIIHIATHYSVAESTVSKWCRDYEINTPPSGYWTGRQYTTDS